MNTRATAVFFISLALTALPDAGAAHPQDTNSSSQPVGCTAAIILDAADRRGEVYVYYRTGVEHDKNQAWSRMPAGGLVRLKVNTIYYFKVVHGVQESKPEAYTIRNDQRLVLRPRGGVASSPFPVWRVSDGRNIEFRYVGGEWKEFHNGVLQRTYNSREWQWQGALLYDKDQRRFILLRADKAFVHDGEWKSYLDGTWH
jgi:hypothetical protein